MENEEDLSTAVRGRSRSVKRFAFAGLALVALLLPLAAWWYFRVGPMVGAEQLLARSAHYHNRVVRMRLCYRGSHFNGGQPVLEEWSGRRLDFHTVSFDFRMSPADAAMVTAAPEKFFLVKLRYIDPKLALDAANKDVYYSKKQAIADYRQGDVLTIRPAS